jgi:putative IMPACT (imprinted ancient) family translation regulator
MLTALLHGGVGDIAAVVTRYYGGTKLGTGGLVRAYGGMVQDALQTLPRAERVEVAERSITLDYPHVAAAQQLLAAHEAEVLAHEYQERVSYRVRLPINRVEELVARLRDATRGSVVIDDAE